VLLPEGVLLDLLGMLLRLYERLFWRREAADLESKF